MSQKRTILLVEDETLIALARKKTLQKYDYYVITAFSGEEAIDLTRNTPDIDLILMDINLCKGMDGTETARVILREHDIPIVFLSSHTEQDVVEKTGNITSYGYVEKDSGITVLDACIKVALRLYAAHKGLEIKENLLKKSEEQYRNIFTNMVHGFAVHEIILDEEGNAMDYRFLAVNPAFERLTGLKGKELIGKTVKEVLPGIEPVWIEKYGEVAIKGTQLHFEQYSRNLRRHYEVTAYRHAPLQFACIFSDITKHKKVEKDLREAEQKLRLFINHAPAAIAMLDRDMRYMAVSRRWISDYGLSDQDIMGRSHYDIFPETPERWKEAHRRGLAGEPAQCKEDSLPRKDGALDWVSWELLPWYDQNGNVGGIILFSEIINERKKAEEAIKESEAKYRLLFDGANDTIIISDGEGRILAANDRAAEQLGYTPTELTSAMLHHLDTPEEALHARERIAKLMEQGRLRFETVHRCKDGSLVPTEVSAQLITWDGKPALLGICRDITERKSAEKALAFLSNFWHRVFNSTDAHQAVIGPDGRVLEINDAWRRFAESNNAGDEQTWGVGAQYFKSWASEAGNTDSAEEAFEGIRQVQRGALPHFEVEYPCHSPEKQRWFVMRSTPLLDEPGKVLVSHTNITKRKRAENELKKSKMLLESVLNSTDDLIVVLDRDLKVLVSNWKSPLCAGLDEFPVNVPCYETFINRHAPCEGCRALEVFKTGKPALVEFYNPTTKLYKEANAYPLFDDEGHVTMVVEHVRDVTEQKRAQDNLRLNEKRFRLSQMAASAGTWEWDLRTNENYWSDELWRLYGLEPYSCEPSYERWIKTIHPDDRKHSEDAVRKAAREGTELTTEWRVVYPDGTIRWLMSRGGPLEDADGRVVSLVGIVIDITDRKRAEEALRESERRYRLLFNEATVGIALADYETGTFQSCNEAFLRMTGYDRSEIIGKPQTMLHPAEEGSPGMSRSFMLHRSQGLGETLPDYLLTKDGRIREVEIKTDTVTVDDVKLMQGFFRDVTDERRIERERETTLILLRFLNDENHTYELIRAITAYLQEWTGCEAVGVRLKEGDDFPYFETKGFPREFVEAERSLCARDLDGQLLKDDMGNPVLECMCGNILSGRFDPKFPFFTSGGSFWSNCTTDLLVSTTEEDRQARTRNRCNGEGYESVALIPLKYGGAIIGLLQLNDHKKGRFTPELISFLEGACEQMAIALAQRQAQAALKKSEERFRDISEAAGEYIFELDVDGRITFISDRAQDVLEFTPEELLGKTPFDLLPPSERSRTLHIFKEHVRTRTGFRDLEHQAIVKSGRAIWLSATLVPILDGNGTLTGYRGAAMNVTSGKEAEDAIKASLKEKEVLLKEIHHRVKNNLQIMSSLLNLQSRYLDDPKARDIFVESVGRVKAMALIHDKLYRSENLSRIYFPAYVEDLTYNLITTYAPGKGISLKLDVAPISLDIETAIPLGLILNELISNVLKHAFPEKVGGVLRIGFYADEMHRTMVVSDNGVGFPRDLDFMNTQSLGMQLVVTLVEQLEGIIELERNGGTEFRITLHAGE